MEVLPEYHARKWSLWLPWLPFIVDINLGSARGPFYMQGSILHGVKDTLSDT